MSAQHTPGPWVYESDMNAHVIRGAEVTHTKGDISYQFRDYVATTWGGYCEADARLIAAAPELLAALRQYVACDAIKNDGLAKMAHAAIAKATGATP